MDCLKGEFEVEPGDGGSRCEYLKEKGIVTYLVLVPKQPVKNGINGVVSVPSSHPLHIVGSKHISWPQHRTFQKTDSLIQCIPFFLAEHFQLVFIQAGEYAIVFIP